ncbi:integrator complex assembly factor WDR73 isoform X2 [Anarhichas minor]|uniref:integrator complex assembly factor WDR73 isoform X2 n=1 Tax=Anarhichas minor TaxID=65739 RepID=UPI003F73A699
MTIRVFVQSGTLKLSTVGSQTVLSASSDTSQERVVFCCCRCVVTNDGLTSDLQVWSVGGDDSDVIRLTGRVEGRKRRRRKSVSEGGSFRIAARLSSQVLHGAQSSDVQLTQLISGQILYALETDSDDPLSSLHFMDDVVFLAGCSNGNVYIADTRTSAAPQLHPPPASSGESVLWWTDASSCSVVRLSSAGQAVISDLRNPAGAVSRAQLDVQSGRCNPDVRASWAPALDGCIAVSGFSGAVQIYNTSVWQTESREVQPLFEHRGHAVSSQPGDDLFVTSHVWHPERPRTLLSAASDGSVHVWDWVDQSAASC